MDDNKDISSPNPANEQFPLVALKQMTWTEQMQQLEAERQQRFKKLGLLTLLYAVVYTFCMYGNYSGITMPIWIIATIVYACTALKRFDITWASGAKFHIIAMILLGISTVLTGNPYIITMNHVGFFFLLVSFLLHIIHDDKEWGIGTYLLNITISIFGAVARVGAPLLDLAAFRRLRDHKKNNKALYVLAGLVLAFPCCLVIACLLASADAVFHKILSKALNSFVLPTDWFGICLLFTFAFFSAYCGMCQLLLRQDAASMANLGFKKITSVIAITFTAPITILYVLFSLVQIFYLFLGFGTLPNGITYAEYARTGFFQLVLICALNIFFVLIIQNFVEENRLLRGILLMISACTLIMVASSAYRMILYIAAYQLTFLRIFVLVALTIIALLMGGIMCSLFKKHFPIYKYALVVVSSIYLVFSFSHVDYFIASYNLTHAQNADMENTLQYIGTLSSDAAPVIADYMKSNTKANDTLRNLYQHKDLWDEQEYSVHDSDIVWYLEYAREISTLEQDSTIRNFNISHYIAAKELF